MNSLPSSLSSLLLVALLGSGCASHLQGLPVAGGHKVERGHRDPLAALSAPVLSRFVASQLILQEEPESRGDRRAERAAELLEEAISLSPGQAVLWRYLAAAWASKPDSQKALSAARKAVSLDESNALNLYMLGTQLQRVGAYDEAEGRFREAIAYGLSLGSQHLPHYYLYEVLRQQGDQKGALDALVAWRAALPDSSEPLMLEAKLLWRLGRGPEAAVAAAAALHAEPRSEASLRILLDALMLEPLRAISALEEALKSDWSVQVLHRELVRLYRAIGRFDRALDHVQSMRTLSSLGRDAFLLDEARFRLAMAQGEEALALLEESLTTGRSIDAEFVALLAATYKVVERREEGIERLRALGKDLADESLQIQRQIRQLSAPPLSLSLLSQEEKSSLEEVQAAIEALVPAWDLSRTSKSAEEYTEYLEAEQQRVRLQLRLSFMQRARGNRAACESILAALLDRHPFLGVALNALAYLWAEEGRNLDEALRLQKMALEQQPFSGAFQDTMGWIHFRRGQLDEALEHLEVADRYQPHEPEIIEHLAVVLAALGRKEEAAAQQQRLRGLRDRVHPR